MKRLGAIIAGGKATRFGGDKAAALLNGQPLIEHVADRLRKQVDRLIVVGRIWPGLESVNDLPSAGLGPLGGINGALHYAQRHGFTEVATAGCDVLPVPELPGGRIDGKAIYINEHYLFGVWPVQLAAILDKHLLEQNNHSMRHWVAKVDAHGIHSAGLFYNLNTPLDVAQYAAQQSTLGVR